MASIPDAGLIEVKMSLNLLARRCGYFFNAYLTEGYENKPNVNNGYNCSHPDCGDEDEGIGCCRADTCPLAYPADGDDDDDQMVVEIAEEDFNPRYMTKVEDEGKG